MEIRSAKHLGALARARRLDLDLSQARVAEQAGVSRQWVVAFEAGKPTAEVGNVLRVIRALDLALDVSPARPDLTSVDIDRLIDG
ncbi:MAG: helix-turn-helix transcriptional regulator [Actinobacteria bacterium]|nr:helix-turn-helix transcriptional regulator [Actinomycetota bacterium]